MRGKKESVLLSVEKEEIGGAQKLRRESKRVIQWGVEPYIVRVGIVWREREKVESSEKDKSSLTKVITPPLHADHWEKESQTEVESDSRAEYPGFRKEENELRMDFWT